MVHGVRERGLESRSPGIGWRVVSRGVPKREILSQGFRRFRKIERGGGFYDFYEGGEIFEIF
jgi:hypothetical protein